MGLPHSKFKSWDEHDQALALAWTMLKAQTCPRCGTMSHEWLDEEGKQVEPEPYRLRTYRCQGCVVMDKTRKQHKPNELENIQFYFERPKKWQTQVVTKRGRAKRQ